MPSQGTNSDPPAPPAPSDATSSAGPGPASLPGTLEERVTRIIELMRPTVQADGGDLELVDVSEDGDVVVRLHGACVGCPSSTLTLRTGIERNLQAHIPEVRSVRAIE